MILELVDDFARALEAMPEGQPRRRILTLLNKSIRSDVHFIDRHRDDYPQALFQCLWNCCSWPVSGVVPDTELQRIKDCEVKHQCSDLATLLASWRDVRPANTIWCESLQPPVIPPDSLPDRVLEGHNGLVWKPDFSTDGLRVATAAAWEGKVRVWDISTGDCLRTFATSGYLGPALWIAGGDRLVFNASKNERHELIVWDWRFDRIVRSVELPDSQSDASGVGIAVSPDGRYAAVSYRRGILDLCELDSGSVLSQIAMSQEGVFLIAFVGEGSSLAVASFDSIVRFFAVPSLEEQRSIVIDNLEWCAILPDGDVLAVCSKVAGRVGSHLTLYDGATGAVETVVNDGSSADLAEPQFVACSDDGKEAAFLHERGVTVVHIDQATRVTIPIRFGSSGFPALSKDRRWLALSDIDQVMMWRLDTSRPSLIRRHEWEAREVACSPCGRFVAVATESAFKGSLNRFPFVILDTASGACVSQWQPPESDQTAIDFIAWFHHSTRVAFAGRRQTVWLWEPASKKSAKQMEIDASCLKLLVSPDDACVACACEDGVVRLAEVEGSASDWRQFFSGEGPRPADGAEIPLHFSADSRFLALAVDRAEYSREERIEAVENPIFVYELANPARPIVLLGHSAAVTCLAFNSDSSRLASGSRNGAVKIWDVTTGYPVHDLDGHASSVGAVSFTADGESIVSIDSQPATCLWRSESGELIQRWDGAFNVDQFALHCDQRSGENPVGVGYHLGYEFQVVDLPALNVLAAVSTHFNDTLAFLPQTERLVRWNYGLVEIYRLALPARRESSRQSKQ